MSVEKIQETSNEDANEYGSVRLSKKAMKRLQSKGQYNDSFDSIIERLLNKVDGREPFNGNLEPEDGEYSN